MEDQLTADAGIYVACCGISGRTEMRGITSGLTPCLRVLTSVSETYQVRWKPLFDTNISTILVAEKTQHTITLTLQDRDYR